MTKENELTGRDVMLCLAGRLSYEEAEAVRANLHNQDSALSKWCSRADAFLVQKFNIEGLLAGNPRTARPLLHPESILSDVVSFVDKLVTSMVLTSSERDEIYAGVKTELPSPPITAPEQYLTNAAAIIEKLLLLHPEVVGHSAFPKRRSPSKPSSSGLNR